MVDRNEGNLQAMTVPLLRSLLAPLRSVKVTGPDVVGFQVIVEG